MVSNSTYRRSFIDSSIRRARLYGFQGLDLSWGSANTSDNMANLDTLFQEWRAAVASEMRNSSMSELILTASVHYSPELNSISLPADSIQRNLNWFTHAHAALYDPRSTVNTDFGVGAWMNKGLIASTLVLSWPFYGYAWTLANSNNNSIGAPATGPAITETGAMRCNDIKNFIQQSVNYCANGSTWICFHDVEAVRTKVSYAKEKKLLGYVVWHVSNDDNWELSQAAQLEDVQGQEKQPPSLVIILTTTAAAVLLLIGFMLYIRRKRTLRSKVSKLETDEAATAGYFGSNGVLVGGEEIAVKKLSNTSAQGSEEFKNEVMLTAKLQHVFLARVLGFCIDREEQMLIYEYMPNKSLDYYLFDPIRRCTLDWTKRVEISEGVTQGLLYLQEYSRMTVIHRDLKASKILFDNDLKAKISNIGMTRIFTKEGPEANTDRIVGTLGVVPP
ncbi:conserved hypothetical protein [Ricinus communis]|uniref:non-specific serine/threonine protein kinase n=1 Tax=Ricinus communis TaxID=3988 RepID=B9SC00_RICCO|nr:conserved hypothetical protein [Ricinus communis]